jgi:hypothetical protein
LEPISPISEIADDLWSGEPALILGGGPSIRWLGDLARLDNLDCHVIAVNRALELPIKPDIWMWLDPSFYEWATTGQLGILMELVSRSYGGLRLTRTSDHQPAPETCACDSCRQYRALPASVTQLDWQLGHDLGPSIAGTARTGRSTGFWALNLAYCMGAEPIILLGYDCRGINGQEANWHSGYPRKRLSERTYKGMKSEFEAAAKRCLEEGREVHNASPGTAINGFHVLNTIDEIVGVVREYE